MSHVQGRGCVPVNHQHTERGQFFEGEAEVLVLRTGPVQFERGDDGFAPAWITGEELYHDDVFFELGEAAGFASVLKLSTKCKCCHIERLAKTNKPWRTLACQSKPVLALN